jgi:lysophospholipid acyltransferase (LPLAT)-like uncharacterized protein
METKSEAVPGWAAPGQSPRGTAPVSGAKPDPFHSGIVYRITGWRLWCLLWPASLFLRLYYATLRLRVSPEEERVLRDTSRPVVGIIWHNRSFILPLLLRRYRGAGRCFCLISPSRAASWEEAIYRLLGIRSARGSSSRRGIAAVRELLHAASSGNDLFISPDGPSGPRYEFKRGATAIARMAKVPVLLFGAESAAAWRPHTWDRHFFPLPFSRVTFRARLLENAELFDGKSDEEVSHLLGHHLSLVSIDHGDSAER